MVTLVWADASDFLCYSRPIAAQGKVAGLKKKSIRPPKTRDQHELVIISGMSGAGKASALKTFEDLGYYCVDNLPVGLISNFADLVLDSLEIRRAALVVDIREGARLDKLPQILASLRRLLKTTLIFLEADTDVLVRRYSETRRPHPLGRDVSVRSSLTAERRRLQPLRALADVVVDTTKFNVHELRDQLTERFQGGNSDKNLLISCVSFGYREGVPEDADLVFDVRFLPNPHFIPKFRPLDRSTSRSRQVHSLISANPGIYPSHLRVADLPDPALHPRREELPDHRLRMHRRQASLGDDRRGREEASGQGRI